MSKFKAIWICRLLVVVMAINMLFSAYAAGETIKMSPGSLSNQTKQNEKAKSPELDSSISKWAEQEVLEAYEAGLTYPGIMNQFKKAITREEFCIVVVKLYEKLTNRIVTAGNTPFSDTDNPEIIKANQLGIVYGTGNGKFSPDLNITRQEISVMLFRALKNAIEELDTSTGGDFPFTDKHLIASWAEEGMRFCYKHKILVGVGNNKIAPLDNTTREQAIAILRRAYVTFTAVDESTQTPAGSELPSDSIEIGSSKPESGDTGIIKPGGGKLESGDTGIIKPGGIEIKDSKTGTGGIISNKPGSTNFGLIDESKFKTPAGIINGITKVPGTNQAVKIIDATVYVNEGPTLTSELQKLNSYDRENRLARPVYKTNLNLSVALGENKNSQYSSADTAALIDQDGNKTRWFKFNIPNTQNVKKVVWQVSRRQFTGFKDNWKNPTGLIKSGEVPSSAGEFSINFGSFNTVPAALDKIRIGVNGILSWGGDRKFREIPTSQKVYYVRAVPVDAAGNCIGDPGTGIAVLYGKPMTAPSQRNLTVSPTFKLLHTMYNYEPSYTPTEFPNLFVEKDNFSINCERSSEYWFQFKDYDPSAQKAVIQVSTKPFTGKLADWESPDGLVYSKTYTGLPYTQYYSGEWADAVPVNFAQFSPDSSSMKPGDNIKYYIRAVTMSPYSGSGVSRINFSNTVTANYAKQEPIRIFKEETKIVKSYIPDIKVITYMRIVSEHPDWDKYYQVYRKPKWNEINCKFVNKQTGYTLYPYAHYIFNYEALGLDHMPTVAEYEDSIIPKVLVQGTTVTIKPAEKDKSWWGDLWDAIVDFFESLIEIVAKVVSWAAEAYNGLKAAVISFVASAIPIPGLEFALELMVNAGLMALGLPPTIPNLDQLCEQGLDYLAEVALTEAGLPANEITKGLIRETSEAIGSQVKEAYNKESPNPIDSPFLRNHPGFLEIPAYIWVQISNPYDKPSLPGSFNIDVEWPYKDDITVTSEMGIPPVGHIPYINHITMGLKRGSSIGNPGYPVFKPVRGYKIPVLKPGESIAVKVYLEPYYGMPYPFAPEGDVVTERDFINFYYGHLGELNFSVYTDVYDLPDPEQVAKAQGFIESKDTFYTYKYDRTWSGVSFKCKGSEGWLP